MNWNIVVENTSWLRQTAEKPLYQDMLWSRPENKRFAGKLYIIGGDAHGFGAPGEAFASASAAGIGVARVALPDNLKSLVPKQMHHEIDFLPSVKNGSFSKNSLGELLEGAAWADVTLMAGGIGRNSETATCLEQFILKYHGWLTMTEDALDALVSSPEAINARENTVLVAALGQLQKLWPHDTNLPVIKHSDTMQQFVTKLGELTSNVPIAAVTLHNDQLLVAHKGRVSTTPCSDTVWRVKTAAKASVWLAQSPSKPFEALTTSLIA
jgi:NAD(P)H-hydrate repair Nnr-like enzyme with NAD(P)H-hydrate dehydratase domain